MCQCCQLFFKVSNAHAAPYSQAINVDLFKIMYFRIKPSVRLRGLFYLLLLILITFYWCIICFLVNLWRGQVKSLPGITCRSQICRLDQSTLSFYMCSSRRMSRRSLEVSLLLGDVFLDQTQVTLKKQKLNNYLFYLFFSVK